MDRNSDRLPPLDLIRSFEAAARHLSFTKAAKELFVTQSAVSRSIQALEEHLGVVLFQRRHRALLLTDAGQILQHTAVPILEQLREVTRRIRDSRGTRMLTVTTTVAFASMWLVPRLPAFREQNPGIEVRISAGNEFMDLEREGIDIAIRYCPSKSVPAGSLRLFGETVFPVCSPELLKKAAPPLRQPEDLRRQVLLHLDDPGSQFPWLHWSVWFEVMQLKQITSAQVLRFSHYDHLMQAAIDGQGVALGRSPLVQRWIKQGQLVAPFDKKSVSSRAYFVLTASAAAIRPEAQRFLTWLSQAARREAE